MTSHYVIKQREKITFIIHCHNFIYYKYISQTKNIVFKNFDFENKFLSIWSCKNKIKNFIGENNNKIINEKIKSNKII